MTDEGVVLNVVSNLLYRYDHEPSFGVREFAQALGDAGLLGPEVITIKVPVGPLADAMRTTSINDVSIERRATVDEMTDEMKVPVCGMCKRERTVEDAYDYNPLQVITGQPLGWYSGDDGEMCPECMTKTIRGGA